MLGLGVVMLDNHSGGGDNAFSWFYWLEHTHIRAELDMTVTAMALSLAMAKYSWLGEYDGMPDMMDLLEYFLLREEDDEDDFDDLKVFESLLVGALLGSDMKVVKIDG